MNALSMTDLRLLNPTPSELVLWGLSDPVRVFVKNEPTKVSKIGQRERIINSVSIIQIIIQMYLFKDVDAGKKENWYNGPGSVGIGFTDDMAKLMINSIKREFERSSLNLPTELVCTDIKSMDYSQSADIIELSAYQKIVTNNMQHTMYAKMLSINVFCLAHPLYVLSDGRMYSQLRPGGRRSGELDTSEGNTIAKASLNVLCAFSAGKVELDPFRAPVQRVQGDDGIHQPFCSDAYYKDFHSEFGMVVTGFTRGTPQDFTFCSQRWVNGGCVPLNIVKQLYNLLSNPVYDFDLLRQYIEDHSNDPSLPDQLKLIKDCWPGCPAIDYTTVETSLDPGLFSQYDLN
nr:MAG: hypothetical protein [Crogonang virus 44]